MRADRPILRVAARLYAVDKRRDGESVESSIRQYPATGLICPNVVCLRPPLSDDRNGKFKYVQVLLLFFFAIHQSNEHDTPQILYMYIYYIYMEWRVLLMMI